MMFHFSIASAEATTYPTLKPASPYALENVRNKNALSNVSCNFNVSGKSLELQIRRKPRQLTLGYDSEHVLEME